MTGNDPIEDALFAGLDPGENDAPVLLEQYKLFVGTSEALVQRRQGVNTFFLSANSLLVAGAGLILRGGASSHMESVILVLLSAIGLGLAFVWRRLIHSFRQLSAGKFDVIHALERRLPARAFAAEWKALGEGEDPKVYRPFTRTESMTPIVFAVLHLTLLAASVWTWTNGAN